MSRMKPRPRSEVTSLSIPWSVASSRPRSEMFLCIAECSESTGDSDGNSPIESSIFSIPESPIEEHHIHPDDPFQHRLDDAITAVTRHYRAWQVQQRGGSTGEKGTKRANVSTPDSSHHARKRPHTGKQDRPRLEEDDDAGPGYKRARFPTSSSASGRQLACPFWKKDPENHRQCHKKVLSKIKYVKQHLYQFHEAPITSACCGAVFETEGAHDQHVRARQCQIIPGGVQRQGLTRAQIQEIHRRADPRKTEGEKWFAIWAFASLATLIRHQHTSTTISLKTFAASVSTSRAKAPVSHRTFFTAVHPADASKTNMLCFLRRWKGYMTTGLRQGGCEPFRVYRLRQGRSLPIPQTRTVEVMTLYQ